MSRTTLLLIASLAAILVIPTEVQAGGQASWDLKSNTKFSALDTSSQNTPFQDVTVTLNGAQVGTLLNPVGPLSASASLGIANPGPDRVGTAATFDVFYTGPANNFPADSFFDVFTDFTQPGTTERGKGTVRDIKGDANDPTSIPGHGQSWGIDLSTQLAPGPEYLFSLAGQINSLQPGLSFNGLNVVQGTSPDPNATSFFDIFTEIRFDGSGTINPNLPLFEITMTGTTPEPSTFVLAALGVVALMAVARKRRVRG
jgi:hypothetical protein